MLGTWFGMSGMWLAWPLLAVGLAVLGYVLLRFLVGEEGSKPEPVRASVTAPDLREAQRLLWERYERGEITAGEYAERLRSLGSRG